MSKHQTTLFFSTEDFRSTSDLSLISDMLRFNTLATIVQAQSGHLGASLSCIDILTLLYHKAMKPNDIFILSKGHAAAALYTTLASIGTIPTDSLLTFRKLGGLPGHVDISTPGIHASTGSLGMGISKAVGHALSDRTRNVYVLVGDGEMQEGQNWEAISNAVHHKLHNLHIIIDQNMVQTDQPVLDIQFGPTLTRKLHSFGCSVSECDGHHIKSLCSCFTYIHSKWQQSGKPRAVIIKTIKGSGISFMEHPAALAKDGYYRWHSAIPTEAEYMKAYTELVNRLMPQLKPYSIPIPLFNYPKKSKSISEGHNLKAAFSKLLTQTRDKRIVVFDSDLSRDNGLHDFEKSHPSRFIQCGISEQHMVSCAGAYSRNGYIPIVNTYASFLTSRANEQIFNNCTENSKCIYMGHLAGLLPSKPGKSHQAIRDISLLQSIPNLTLCSPSNPTELYLLFNILLKSKTSGYIRLEHNQPRYLLPSFAGTIKPGIGRELFLGSDLTILTYGPTMCSEAVHAQERIFHKKGIFAKIINLPWLNHINTKWLKSSIKGPAFCIENHSIHGGLSCELRKHIPVTTIGIEGIAESGENYEALEHFKLDGISIGKAILHELKR